MSAANSARFLPVLALCFFVSSAPAEAQAGGATAVKPAAESLPDTTSLLADVQKNQNVTEKILESYTYTKTEEEQDLNNQGQMKSKRTQQYEVFYVNGREVQKLVVRDGKSLQPAERQKEEERVRKLVLKYTADAAKGVNIARTKSDDDDELHISTFLRAARFTRPRREQFREQQVIAFDIEPNPAYHAQNLNERLVQRLSGVMWVDDRAHQVARLDAHLGTSANIGGGLLGSVQKGSAAVFEQALVNGRDLAAFVSRRAFVGTVFGFQKLSRGFGGAIWGLQEVSCGR